MLTAHDGWPFGADEDEHLIHLGMDFLANLAASKETHQHGLAIYTGGDLVTKVLVLLRKRYDISVELLGATLSFLIW